VHANKLVFATIAFFGASAVAIAFLNTTANNSRELETIEIREYLVNSTIAAAVSGDQEQTNHEIRINGIWTKELVTVSFRFDNLKYDSETRIVAHQAINGPITGYNLTGWNIVFDTMLNNTGSSPTHLVIPSDSGDTVSDTDIHVVFTNEQAAEDINGNKPFAVTTLTVLPDKSLDHASTVVYGTDSLYEGRILVPVLIHELGHGLGLGHSTKLDSIMYPRIVIHNDKIGGNISICEIAALNAYYVARQDITESLECQ
jgi:hypothetical protein